MNTEPTIDHDPDVTLRAEFKNIGSAVEYSQVMLGGTTPSILIRLDARNSTDDEVIFNLTAYNLEPDDAADLLELVRDGILDGLDRNLVETEADQ